MNKIVWLACLLWWQGGLATSYSGTDLIGVNGFSIPAGDTVTVNVPIPVTGTIDGNNTGTLSLLGDLFLDSSGNFGSNGIKIDGQGHALHLFGNNTLPSGKTIEVTSSLTIDGHNNRVDLNTANFYLNGTSGTTLRLKNMTLYALKGSGSTAGIRVSATTGQKLVLENVSIYLVDDYTFTGGALDIYGNVVLVGDYAFTYASSQNCTIKSASMLLLDMHVTFKYMPGDSSANHLKFANLTSTLGFRGGTLYVPSTIGLNLKKGHLVVDHKSYVAQNWVSPEFGTGSGRIAFGDGRSTTNNMAIDMLPGGQLIAQAAAVDYGIVDA